MTLNAKEILCLHSFLLKYMKTLHTKDIVKKENLEIASILHKLCQEVFSAAQETKDQEASK